eukprot:EC118876.1.p1 GENE.EC118876.1~~EC118876.1.p1  ORF type:complete len:100 (+),score=7.68 EC118876.1:132-431(+)
MSATLGTRREVLRLYKDLLRSAQGFRYERPRSKTIYNIREVFQIYKSKEDPDVVTGLIERGKHDLRVLQLLARLDQDISELIFTDEVLKQDRKATQPSL